MSTQSRRVATCECCRRNDAPHGERTCVSCADRLIEWKAQAGQLSAEIKRLGAVLNTLTSEPVLRIMDGHIAAILDDDDMPCLADWQSAIGAALKQAANMVHDRARA